MFWIALQELRDASPSWAEVRLPTPGISRSMTYLGMEYIWGLARIVPQLFPIASGLRPHCRVRGSLRPFEPCPRRRPRHSLRYAVHHRYDLCAPNDRDDCG